MRTVSEEYKNPFRPTRFEHHGRPLIWLSKKSELLEAAGSYYLSGSRGCGKTTLLRSLNWWERLHNETLQDQLKDRVAPFLGVYFRLPDYLSNSLAYIPWDKIYPASADLNGLDYNYFSLFIEAIVLQLLCEAATELRSNQLLNYEADAEVDLVERILRDWPELAHFQRDKLSQPTLVDLSAIYKSMYESMHSSARRGLVDHIVNKLPQSVEGHLLQTTAKTILSFLTTHKVGPEPTKLHLKVCLDDCEMLIERQQVYLNTLVRKSQFPVFWIISYVAGNYQSSATLIPQQSLTDADRKVISLEPESKQDIQEFFALCEAVSELRVFYSDASLQMEGPFISSGEKFFNVRNVLGPTDINWLLHKTAKNKLASGWGKLAEQSQIAENIFRPMVDGGDPLQELEGDNDTPLYYQAYLINKLGKQVKLEKVNEKSRRKLSAYLRRKQRAALLCMCSELGLANIPYAGWNVVYSMADGCIRDYLEIMAEIFESFSTRKENKVAVFRNTRIQTNVQRIGILKASTAKFNGIKDYMESHAAEGSTLVECLGQLCRRLQSNHENLDCLKTAERGVFVFDLKKFGHQGDTKREAEVKAVKRVLSQCELAGIMRPIVGGSAAQPAKKKSVGAVLRYRLHRRFAAHFRYSYGGPHAQAILPLEEVVSVCLYPESIIVNEWVDLVEKKMGGSVSAQPVFHFDETR